MNPAARLQATIDLLTEIAATARPADAIMSAFFRGRRYIGAKDRTAVAEAAYAVLRRQARLGWWLERANRVAPDPAPGGDSRMRVIANLILVDGRRADHIAALFSGDKYAPQPLTPAEAGLARALETHTLEHPGMSEAVRCEVPGWAEPGLRTALGDHFFTELSAMNSAAPLDIRVNPVKSTRDAVRERLKTDGIESQLTALAPFGLRLGGRPPLAAHELFRAGAFEIQDEGSQLVSLLVDARPGQRVVDFCAGAGGKTLALAAAMANRGRLVACDVLDKRLQRAAERLRRGGLHNVETRPLNGERDPWVKHHKSSFDRVLADVPCSGTGTWRRNPDARWRQLGPGLSELIPLQKAILDSAARLVRPGGRLIYATCSLLPEENEQQIEHFLAGHSEFRPLPLAEVWAEVAVGPPPNAGPWLRLTPATHACDGFFAAVLKRADAPPPVAKPAGVAPESSRAEGKDVLDSQSVP
ncbi:16S rRNA (cytosine967-C5)-methyltransferase [uncultured Gammaproteobacteria bacterium]